MSINKVKKATADFLATAEPEVLSIKGGWGVGKTHFWSNSIINARDNECLKVNRYAYISLFGITSLDELKYAIFEQTVNKSQIGKPVTISNLNKNWDDIGKQLGRKLSHLIQLIPGFGNTGSAIRSASFLSIRNAIICIDDFERKGDKLKTKDILGLVSLLKEQRDCKVVLIFNDANMNDESITEYRDFREKVIDVEVKYAPIPIEAAALVFKTTSSIDVRLAELCTKLGIINIRILYKIKKVIDVAEPLLVNHEKEVFDQVTHTITIATWCYYSRDKAIPSYEHLLNSGRHSFGLEDKKEKTDSEKDWDAILTNYEFRYTDDFDHLLFNVIESGYIDEESFLTLADIQNETVKAGKSTKAYSAAWELYHSSFNDNEDDLVSTLIDALESNGKHVSQTNMSGAVFVLRQLGRNTEASKLITTYIELNKDKPSTFDLSSQPFSGDIDPEVIRRFNETFNASKEIKTLDDALEGMIDKDGWGGIR